MKISKGTLKLFRAGIPGTIDFDRHKNMRRKVNCFTNMYLICLKTWNFKGQYKTAALVVTEV